MLALLPMARGKLQAVLYQVARVRAAQVRWPAGACRPTQGWTAAFIWRVLPAVMLTAGQRRLRCLFAVVSAAGIAVKPATCSPLIVVMSQQSAQSCHAHLHSPVVRAMCMCLCFVTAGKPWTCKLVYAGCYFKNLSWDTTIWAQQQSGQVVKINITLRHEADPYLAFLDISDGTKSFGASTKEKVRLQYPNLVRPCQGRTSAHAISSASVCLWCSGRLQLRTVVRAIVISEVSQLRQ